MLYNVWEENGKLKYEGTKEVKKTLNYAYSLVNRGLLDYVGWSVTVPYPGSKLYNIACRHNLIKKEYVNHWENWLKRNSYVMELPGITKSEQIRMKTWGSILRAKLILKNKEFRLKDLNWMGKKAIKVLLNELKLFK